VAAVWYRVRDLGAARRFYTEVLGFSETFLDDADTWAELDHGEMAIALAEGEPDPDCGVAHVEVPDVIAEADRLRAAGVEVGVVLELHGEIRIVDVFDPDGNRLQFAQALR